MYYVYVLKSGLKLNQLYTGYTENIEERFRKHNAGEIQSTKLYRPMKKLQIPESELQFSFSRSGGAGGQNVNKVETKVTVYWNFKDSSMLSEKQKLLIEKGLKNRINEKKELIVYSQTERSQAQNKKKTLEILNDLVNQALTVPEKRKPTKVPPREKEKRLEEKRRQTKKKEFRRAEDY